MGALPTGPPPTRGRFVQSGAVARSGFAHHAAQISSRPLVAQGAPTIVFALRPTDARKLARQLSITLGEPVACVTGKSVADAVGSGEAATAARAGSSQNAAGQHDDADYVTSTNGSAVRVYLMVDNEEAVTDEEWQRRLRERALRVVVGTSALAHGALSASRGEGVSSEAEEGTGRPPSGPPRSF